MSNVSKDEYYRALNQYFHQTQSSLMPSIRYKIVDIVELINSYEKKNRTLSKGEINSKVWLNVVAQVVGVLIYSALTLFAASKILELELLSYKNILLLALVFGAYKVKFRLTG
jgi:hypothetical protein